MSVFCQHVLFIALIWHSQSHSNGDGWCREKLKFGHGWKDEEIWNSHKIMTVLSTMLSNYLIPFDVTLECFMASVMHLYRKTCCINKKHSCMTLLVPLSPSPPPKKKEKNKRNWSQQDNLSISLICLVLGNEVVLLFTHHKSAFSLWTIKKKKYMCWSSHFIWEQYVPLAPPPPLYDGPDQPTLESPSWACSVWRML